MLHQGPLGDFPMLAWLLHRRCQARCCLHPGVSVGTRHVRTFRFACAYYQGIGTFPKFTILGAMGPDSGHTPLTSFNSRFIKNFRIKTLPGG